MSLLEGGGRQLFILVAEIRGRAAFISADLQIHEGCGGSRRGAGGPEKLTINFTRPYRYCPSTLRDLSLFSLEGVGVGKSYKFLIQNLMPPFERCQKSSGPPSNFVQTFGAPIFKCKIGILRYVSSINC